MATIGFMITYYVNAEWEAQEEDEQIQVEGVSKSSTAGIVIPSSTKRGPDTFP